MHTFKLEVLNERKPDSTNPGHPSRCPGFAFRDTSERADKSNGAVGAIKPDVSVYAEKHLHALDAADSHNAATHVGLIATFIEIKAETDFFKDPPSNSSSSQKKRSSHAQHSFVLDHIKNQAKRRRMIANLFHSCIRVILEPIRAAGKDGVPVTSGDGVTRRGHPIYAAFCGDYPEQVQVNGVKTGECPTCGVAHENLGDFDKDDRHAFRDLEAVLELLSLADDAPADFLKACREAGIKPIYQPFWQGLPYADPFLAIAPDVLHQLYQGVIKHLVAWVIKAFGAEEVDARCRRLPPNHSARLFTRGISHLSRVTGQEHSDMARILLGLVVDLPLPDGQSPIRLVRAVRAMLDFCYLAQYPVHSTRSLDALDDALHRFHQNKDVFVDLGVRTGWEIPKLHWLEHYRQAIERLGTADNFNTEYTERLHIDMAKDAYEATNGKDIYSQMTIWLERKEKVLRHARFIEWREKGCPPLRALNPLDTCPQGSLKMTQTPSARGVLFEQLVELYGAVDFQHALSEFIVQHRSPGLSRQEVAHRAQQLFLPFIQLPVYHKARLWDPDFRLFRSNWQDYDVIHVKPSRLNKYRQVLPARFDTAVIKVGESNTLGANGKLQIPQSSVY